MKLKRIASAVMAAVMAVTSAVVCEVTASAASTIIVSNETISDWNYESIDLTSKGTPTADATITITLDSAVGSAEDNVVFKIYDSGWSLLKQQNVEDTTSTSLTSYTYSIANDLGGNTSLVFQAGHTPITYSLTVSDVEAPAYEGTKLAVALNTYEGGQNWQGTEALTLPSAVSISSAEDIINNYGNVTVTVPLNGAVSGTNTSFDLTKLSFQLVPKTNNGGDWPWITAGTSTYDPATKTVTITADLAAALNGNTSIAAAPDDYTFNCLELMVACDYDSASAAIDLYHGTPTVTFSAATVAVESVTLDKTTLSLVEEETATLTATVAPANATDKTVTWTSSATDVATVDSTGKVTAVKAGTATITAKAGEKTAACDVTVTAKTVYATSVTLSEQTLSLKVGGEAVLTATVLPENATNKKVSWTSDNREVATVDQNGKVTAVAPGEAQIRVSANGLNSAAGLEVCNVCMVTVSEADIPVKTVTITKPTTTEYTVGSDVTLEAKVNTDATVSDKTIKWSSSDADVASVDETTGKVTFKKAGEVTITAFYGSKSTIKDTITLVVSEPVNDDYIESPIHYDETTADAAKPINITLNGSSTNSVLYVMSVSEQDAKTYNGVKVKVLNDDGTVIKEITLDTLYQAFKFVGADNVKYIESGIAGRYFAIVRIDNVNAVGSFTVSMELVK